MNLSVIKAVFMVRLKVYLRYPGWIILGMILPLILSIIPVMIGYGIAGSLGNANNVFSRIAGTKEFVFYIILGSTVWSIGNGIIWDFGMWLYEEMEAGTLEQIFLTPVSPLELLLGAVSYTLITTFFNAIAGLFVASAVLGCLHLLLTPKIFVALLIIILGFIPLLGMSLAIGAAVLRMKEPWAIFNFLTALLVYISGVFYPITILPMTARIVAVLFPPTIQIADSRAVLLSLDYIFSPEIDTIILVSYALIWPILGLMLFRVISSSARKRGSIGAY